MKISTMRERAALESAPEPPRVSFVQSGDVPPAASLPNLVQLPSTAEAAAAGHLPWQSPKLRNAIPLLTEGESAFYLTLRSALRRVHCVAMAKVHLPTVTHGVDFDGETSENLRRAREALSTWEAQFVICHGPGLKVMAVVRLASPGIHHPLRTLMQRRVDNALAGVEIPVVHFSEAETYSENQIVAALMPYLA